ncbi:YoaK family protein [uncultured Sphingomonas sp.]|uniref:YoaK family protein n=1 Tax=uncultured Sphingomonas sp. TaxID=158754 RepID=UPI0025F3D383|nr:YoaK family protein [uncultured Sphingomonas sp.]
MPPSPAAETPAPSPLPWLLLLLSMTTGLVDAVSVLGLGKVFTANMTGNIVFLGFAAAGTPGFSWPPYVVALLTFMGGALMAGRVGRAYGKGPLGRWLIRSALVEAVLLWAAALVALGYDIARPEPARVFAIISLTAIAMGFRNATIRQLKVPDLTTTVLTLTITGIAADSSLAGGGNANWSRRLGAVIAIFLGALIGALLVMRSGLALPLALAGGAVLLGTLACARHPTLRQP